MIIPALHLYCSRVRHNLRVRHSNLLLCVSGRPAPTASCCKLLKRCRTYRYLTTHHRLTKGNNGLKNVTIFCWNNAPTQIKAPAALSDNLDLSFDVMDSKNRWKQMKNGDNNKVSGHICYLSFCKKSAWRIIQSEYICQYNWEELDDFVSLWATSTYVRQLSFFIVLFFQKIHRNNMFLIGSYNSDWFLTCLMSVVEQPHINGCKNELGGNVTIKLRDYGENMEHFHTLNMLWNHR